MEKMKNKKSTTSRKDQIIETAVKLFYDRCFDAISVNDIASTVGITKAGIYHFIKNKEYLLYQIINYGLDLLESEVMKPAKSIKDPEERIRFIFANHIRIITGEHKEYQVAIHERNTLSPEYQNKIILRKRKYLDFIIDTLTALKEQKKTRNIDVTSAAFALLGMINWFYQWYKADGRLSEQKLIDDMVNIFFNGFSKPAPIK
jgi:AcrR family transcriptional regulator